MRSLLIAAAAVVSLVGCAAPLPPAPPDRFTPSGKAEAIFQDRTADEVREAIVSGCLSIGRQAQATTSEVVCSGTIGGGKGALIQISMGNSYSTPPEHRVRFTLLPRSDKSVRVIAHPWIQTTMAGGQVRQMDDDDVRSRNDLQRFLSDIGGI